MWSPELCGDALVIVLDNFTLGQSLSCYVEGWGAIGKNESQPLNLPPNGAGERIAP